MWTPIQCPKIHMEKKILACSSDAILKILLLTWSDFSGAKPSLPLQSQPATQFLPYLALNQAKWWKIKEKLHSFWKFIWKWFNLVNCIQYIINIDKICICKENMNLNISEYISKALHTVSSVWKQNKSNHYIIDSNDIITLMVHSNSSAVVSCLYNSQMKIVHLHSV